MLRAFIENGKPYHTLVMLAAFLFCMVLLMAPPFFLYTRPAAAFLVRLGLFPQGTVLVDLNFVAPVIGLFGAIFGAAVLPVLPFLSNRERAMKMAYSSIMTSDEFPFFLWPFYKRATRKAGTEDPGAWCQAFLRAQSLAFGLIALLLFVIAGIFLSWDIASAPHVVPNGVSSGHYFRYDRQLVPWNSVARMTTGCDGKTDGKRLSYRVHLADGRSFNLANAQPLQGLSRMEALTFLDERLRTAGVPWGHSVIGGGKRKGESLDDPSCLRHERFQFPGEEAAFDRVFRLDPPAS